MPDHLPPLRTIRAGLRRATEALAAELALPGGGTPDWTPLEWRLAMAAAAAHGVSPLLDRRPSWQHAPWKRFLADQHEHVELRHRRIVDLLHRLDAAARAAGVPLVPLKGAALHALGLYAAGERPMADIDLLVHPGDAQRAAGLLQELGYESSFTQWKHQVFKPVAETPVNALGEHRDTPVNIELHTHIHERLPLATVDLTATVYPHEAQPGLNAYPSQAALMGHLLLHAAGNLCGRSLRLLHLNDISLLATRMTPRDWDVLWQAHEPPWWALPPLRLVARYYRHAVPGTVLERLERDCPPLLRAVSSRWTLSAVSCSDLWLHGLAGMEWCRSPGEVARYLHNRLRPTDEARRERADMVRTQLWLQGQSWVVSSQRRRILAWLTRPVPRMDTLYVVRAALESRLAEN
ncbi:nucleotidyltransferase family protein [Frateuria edaphi]|uniref:nucleotidyltransferase family protein n=1 Tax=Frateuria edaphi TaxID=2898793 RepID=UPI001E559E78|nr:nucleotidyltransferase family protein [Frateuria edaphi]UGB45251.1 nucleotidyltransferase family protein [Frateuria edaphi]